MTYEEYYWTQSGHKRFRLNEITIWAVNKLYDTQTNVNGTKNHIAARQEQLINDLRIEGWRKAAKRFRRSIDQWVETNTFGDQVYPTSTQDTLHGTLNT